MGRPLTVMHVVARSHPTLSGYTIRTKCIINAQAELGHRVASISSPFYAERIYEERDQVIEGIPHLRSHNPLMYKMRLAWLASHQPGLFRSIILVHLVEGTWCKWSKVEGGIKRGLSKVLAVFPGRVRRKSLRLTMRAFRKVLHRIRARYLLLKPKFWFKYRVRLRSRMKYFFEDVRFRIKSHKIDIVHAHTPFKCGLPAIAAGRLERVPVVYEMRGLWEDTTVFEGRMQDLGQEYRLWRRMETNAFRRCAWAVPISFALKEELGQRGVVEASQTVVPNGICLAGNEILSGPSITKSETCDHVMIGYVGSLRDLEGVDILIDAMGILRDRGVSFRGLIVGGGPSLVDLKEQSRKLGLQDQILLPGRVSHSETASYYDKIDIFVVSRRKSRVTNLVTPLKPMEAMLHGCSLVMSDLAASREFMDEGRNGVLFEAGDAQDLARVCEDLISSPSLRASMSGRGRRWALENRTWPTLVKVYDDIYRQLVVRPVDG